MSWRPIVALTVLATCATVHADSHWYDGAPGKRRLLHVGGSVLGGALYVASETVLKPSLAASECRWCNPPSLDRSVRDALRWGDTARAAQVSNVTGFVMSPVVGLGLIAVASLGSGDARAARWIDDALPILESLEIASLVCQTVKFGVARQRPDIHFGDPARPHELEDNVSFFSGHTTLVFSVATSAGLVAHRRHYKLEPVIWATGYALAGATGYLRIAADRHYFTDVVVGAIAGTGIGVAVPLALHGATLARDVAVVPTGRGVAVVGTF